MRMAQPIGALMLGLLVIASTDAQQPIATFGNMPKTINTGTFNPTQTMKTSDLTSRFKAPTPSLNSKLSLTSWMPSFNLPNVFKEKTAPTGVTVLTGKNNPFQPVAPKGYDMLNPPKKTK
jgi:hypothetical protein